jgi:hypothetical protein
MKEAEPILRLSRSIDAATGNADHRYLRQNFHMARSSHGRGGGIRTPDPLLPKQMRYQTALRPDL